MLWELHFSGHELPRWPHKDLSSVSSLIEPGQHHHPYHPHYYHYHEHHHHHQVCQTWSGQVSIIIIILFTTILNIITITMIITIIISIIILTTPPGQQRLWNFWFSFLHILRMNNHDFHENHEQCQYFYPPPLFFSSLYHIQGLTTLFCRFERVLGPCSDILKRNIQQYNSFVSLSV